MTKQRVHEILEVAGPGDKASRVFDIALVSLIAANVLAAIIETVPEVGGPCARAFHVFELVSVSFFLVEYVLRLWSCTTSSNYPGALLGRLKKAGEPMMVIDLVAILPSLLPMLFAFDLRVVRALRLLRVMRIFRTSRYSQALQVLGRVISRKKAELSVTVFVVGILLIVFSSLMYIAEHDAQPEKFRSIPDAMWWAVAALSTVGYGDIYPITAIGRVLGTIVALLGIGMFALPAGVLASGFSEEFGNKPGMQSQRYYASEKRSPSSGTEGTANDFSRQ
jgi:voltage-gated potassium channel